MTNAVIDGLKIEYELIGDSGPAWTITPGGRYSKDTPGIRELAQTIAAEGFRVLIWDRPNTGQSDLCFEGSTESEMQAAALAGLIRHLDLGKAIIVGGSGGSRVSLLTAAQHRDVAAGLAIWWLSGGIYGMMSLGVYYGGPSFEACFKGGMQAVADLPMWSESYGVKPENRDKILAQDPKVFMETMERWMDAYAVHKDELVPGLPDADAKTMDIPALVFRSGVSDIHHRRETSEYIAHLLPNSQLVEPPWPDTEWADRHLPENASKGLFANWPKLAPQLLEWARTSVLK
jgi:pimeloyl-ACP methyl ester carboxylesterase